MDRHKGMHKETLSRETILAAVREAVKDGCLYSYLSLDCLLGLKKKEQPDLFGEALHDYIIQTFTAKNLPVPRQAQWNIVFVRLDDPDGTCHLVTEPDVVVPGYCVAVSCNKESYERRRQEFRAEIMEEVDGFVQSYFMHMRSILQSGSRRQDH